LRQCQRKIARRIRHDHRPAARPVLTASNIHYEFSARDHGLAWGGIGAIHLLARRVGLVEALNRRLHLLKVHLPYHESDHVLAIPYNLLADGTCLQDLDTLRQREAFLDALGAKRLPDPTTAGDFCRRFSEADVWTLQETINTIRIKFWRQQPQAFFRQAVLDADGTMAPTTGECKQGMDIAYDGTWGYHPLVLSLANTKEPLFLVNRPGNRPSHEGAAACFDQSIRLCREAGFKSIALRGDTDFSQTAHLDRWDAQRDVKFCFGINAMKVLIAQAEALPPAAWQPLERPVRYQVQTQPRTGPQNVKDQIVREREYQRIRQHSEAVAEFCHQPGACHKAYRIVVLKKNLSVEKGEAVLFDDVRYFFYITNDDALTAAQVVFFANDRCDQENLLAQLKSGVGALKMPTGDLVSNWAYMVMAALAWSFKAWLALSLKVAPGRWRERHEKQQQQLLRMEFKGFVNALIRLPCQIVKSGRKIVFRLLGWSPGLNVFLRAVDSLRRPMLC
jgi:hypothetical protein